MRRLSQTGPHLPRPALCDQYKIYENRSKLTCYLHIVHAERQDDGKEASEPSGGGTRCFKFVNEQFYALFDVDNADLERQASPSESDSKR